LEVFFGGILMKRFIFAVVVFSILLAFWACAEEVKELSWDEKYQDQPFVFLLLDTTLELKENWSFTEKIHVKMKIQKEEGKDMGEIPLPYNRAREKITKIEAYTITPDGKRHKYSKIQDFHEYEGYPMYSDSRLKVITMPKVVVGSTIEYKATLVTKTLPIAKQFWNDFYFGSGNPVKEYKAKVILPKKLGVKYKAFNLEHKPAIEETDKKIIYSWDVKEVEEREYEEFMPPPTVDTVASCAQFSSIGSWNDVSDWYYGLVEKNMVINGEIKAKAEELAKGREAVKDKVRAILEYLQDDFRYVSMSLGQHTFEPHPTDQVFKNKYGDCKDLSLLCKAMLKVVGIEANMVLFRSEFEISDPQHDLPFPNLFNHVLLEVQNSSGNFYVDPLLKGYDMEEYPAVYQKGYTIIITEDGGKFGCFPVFDEKRLCSSTESTIEIKEDGSALIEAEILWDLDASVETRNMWKAASQKEKDEFMQMIGAYTATGGKVIEQRWKNMDGRYGHLKIFLKYERPNAYPLTDNMIIIGSQGNERVLSFSKEKRENPMFYPFNTLIEQTISYVVPKGFEISHVPDDLDLAIRFFSCRRNYRIDERKLIVKEVSRYTRKELPVEEYKEVQDFFDKLPGKTNQHIVIRKIADE